MIHPQIAAFARLADKAELPVRKIEGAATLRVWNGRLALVEHLHVAAERYHRQPVFGAIGMLAAPDGERLAEADREAQHLETETPGDPEVAELVSCHEDADRDDEPKQLQH